MLYFELYFFCIFNIFTLKDTTNAFLAHSLTNGESIFGVGDMFKTKFLSED